MSRTQERRTQITQMLKAEALSAIELAESLDAAPSTVYSDLRFLEEAGRVQRAGINHKNETCWTEVSS